MTGPPLNELRGAVIGTGFMAAVHVEALARLGVPVLGVVGSSLPRAAEHARVRGLPTPYASVEEMLADDRVDVVHITSPNDLHHEHALAALRAGKHVICEKPLAVTAEQSAELLAEAERSGLVHAVNFMSRFYPHCQEARVRVANGSVGEVRLISGAYLQDWLSRPTDWNWRVDPRVAGELRAVGDIGSHWLDLVSFISGQRVHSVMAELITAIPVRQRPGAALDSAPLPWVVDTEDIATVLLRFDGGARGVMTVSQVSPGRKNRLTFELAGADRSLAWNSESPEDMWIGAREVPNQLLVRDPALMSAEAGSVSDYPAGHAQGFPDAFKALHRRVYTAVANGEPREQRDFPTFADGHAQMLIADAVALSAQEERWVVVEPEPAALDVIGNTNRKERE